MVGSSIRSTTVIESQGADDFISTERLSRRGLITARRLRLSARRLRISTLPALPTTFSRFLPAFERGHLLLTDTRANVFLENSKHGCHAVGLFSGQVFRLRAILRNIKELHLFGVPVIEDLEITLPHSALRVINLHCHVPHHAIYRTGYLRGVSA